MAGRGLQYLTLNRIPEKWDKAWFGGFIREVLALADTRNALEGPGILIEGQPGEVATISTSEDLQDLLLQSFVVAQPSGFLQFERTLAGDDGVHVVDGGPNANITVKLQDGGVTLGKLTHLSDMGVLGNPINAIGPVQLIQSAAVDGETLAVQAGELLFTNVPTWSGNHTWVDNAEIRLGTGGDLRLYHDGSNSFITNTTGLLYITTPVAALVFTDNFQLRGNTPEYYLKNLLGGVDEKTWRINATGAALVIGPRSDADVAGPASVHIVRSGNAPLAFRLPTDNNELQIGAGNDLRAYHDGTNSIIRNDTGILRLQSGAVVALEIAATTGALSSARTAAWTGAHTFTNSAGVTVASGTAATGARLDFIGQSGGINRFRYSTSGGGSSDFRIRDDSAAVDRFNIDTSGHIYLPADNQELRIGAATSGDLRLYHDGTDSFVRNDTGDLRLNIAGNTRFRIHSDGRLSGTALHNVGVVTGTANQFIASGTYTPTLTGVTNVAASTARLCSWIRVGNVVHVAGQLDIDVTAAVATELGISLPIASALSTAFQLGGTAAAPLTNMEAAAIDGDATNDRARMRWVAVNLASHTMTFSFSYEVL